MVNSQMVTNPLMTIDHFLLDYWPMTFTITI